MFTPEDRTRLRSQFLERAAKDTRITGAAVTGSAAAELEDQWSDIDLAFGVGEDAELQNVIGDWTAYMYADHGVLHHFDMKAGAWIYRVFLLPGTLQVDLAFVPAVEFRPLAASFRLMFGHSNEIREVPKPLVADIIGLAWLYALHVRSSIARGKLWQAEYMVSGMRDNVLALTCIRCELPYVHGRGMDQLPKEVTNPLKECLVRQLEVDELARAFRVGLSLLLVEIRNVDEMLAGRLVETFQELGETCSGTSA